MITEGLFIEEWDKVTASHGRGFTRKIADAWYAELEETDPDIFRRTMRQLALGRHNNEKRSGFPRWEDFWTIYRMTEHDLGLSGGEIGCDKCCAGTIHYLRTFPGINFKYECVGFCRDCHPHHRFAVDPNQAFEYVLGKEPWRKKEGTMIPASVVPEMIRELTEKMERDDIDWKQETIEAWALHKKAVAGG